PSAGWNGSPRTMSTIGTTARRGLRPASISPVSRQPATWCPTDQGATGSRHVAHFAKNSGHREHNGALRCASLAALGHRWDKLGLLSLRVPRPRVDPASPGARFALAPWD